MVGLLPGPLSEDMSGSTMWQRAVTCGPCVFVRDSNVRCVVCKGNGEESIKLQFPAVRSVIDVSGRAIDVHMGKSGCDCGVDTRNTRRRHKQCNVCEMPRRIVDIEPRQPSPQPPPREPPPHLVAIDRTPPCDSYNPYSCPMTFGEGRHRITIESEAARRLRQELEHIRREEAEQTRRCRSPPAGKPRAAPPPYAVYECEHFPAEPPPPRRAPQNRAASAASLASLTAELAAKSSLSLLRQPPAEPRRGSTPPEHERHQERRHDRRRACGPRCSCTGKSRGFSFGHATREQLKKTWRGKELTVAGDEAETPGPGRYSVPSEFGQPCLAPHSQPRSSTLGEDGDSTPPPELHELARNVFNAKAV